MVILGLVTIIGTGGSSSDNGNGGNDSVDEQITNSIGMSFNYIEPGTFVMGSPSDEPGRDDDETQHEVTLTQGYYMQTTEVTQGQWKAVMGGNGEDLDVPDDLVIVEGAKNLQKAELEDNPSYFSDCGDDCPVENVSWDDAQGFIDELNKMGEGTYRLPTEAEWEYAARAGSTTAFANGQITETGSGYDPVLDSMGWYLYNSEVIYAGCYDARSWGGSSCAGTHPVAQKEPNDWGLYDMHGNVWEWVADRYGDYPSSAETDPTGPEFGNLRVIRGGSWRSHAGGCRSAHRVSYGPGYRFNGRGFRLVLLPGH